MKITVNKNFLDAVKNLAEVIEARRKLESEEKELKASVKEIMAGLETAALSAGDYLVVVTTRTRKELDKELVRALLGDKYAECEKKAEYQIMEVKKA